MYQRVMYGCRVLEKFSEAKIYYEMKRFCTTEYTAMIENELNWMTESAYLDLHTYELLQELVDTGVEYLGNEQVKSVMLSGEISKIVDKLISTRNYAKALDLNDKVKNIFQRNYDLERIQQPLEMETKIYQRMHKDKRVNYASYFMAKFLGVAHAPDFKD